MRQEMCKKVNQRKGNVYLIEQTNCTKNKCGKREEKAIEGYQPTIGEPFTTRQTYKPY